MDTSIENEERDCDYLMESTSSHEITFSDWHFVDQSRPEEQGSDDDSVEIIEYEASIPLPSSATDAEESEIEDYFNDFTNDGDEVDFAEVDVQSIIVPYDRCLSYSASRKTLDQHRIISNGATWKVLYAFVLGVFAIFVFHQYKGYILNGVSVLSLSNALNLTGGYPFSFSNEEHEITIPPAPTEEDDELSRMRKDCEERKNILDGTLMKPLQAMKHARRLRDDVYFLEIPNIASRPTEEDELTSRLNLDKPVLPCEDNVTSEQLPLVCKNGHAFLVFVKESQFIEVHDSILRFFEDTEGRAVALYENMIASLTKRADSEKIMDDCDTRILVHDWDDYSKSYRLNYRCFISSKVQSMQSQKVIEAGNIHSDGLRFSEAVFAALTKLMQSDDEEEDFNVNCKTCRVFEKVIENELKAVMEKENEENNYGARMELNKFAESCRPCRLSESTLSVMQGSPAAHENSNTDEKRPKETARQEGKEPMSGEWLPELHEARAKLRSYYDRVVSVDWFLKVGRAWDKLYNDGDRNHGQNGDSRTIERAWKKYRQWYKREVGTKLESEFQTFKVNLKHYFGAAKESIASTLEELKSKFTNEVRK